MQQTLFVRILRPSKGKLRGELFWVLISVIFGCSALLFLPSADELYTKNKAAAKYYNKGSYDEALKSYDNLILEVPQEPKLKMNKGSVQYKLGDFDKADESYNAATSTKDKNALADLYYNLGNTQYMQADQMAAKGDNKAMDKYKAALENYIKSLDIKPSDKDSKWNVQLVQKKIKEMKQQQQQQNNKDNKQDKDNKDQKKNNQQQNKQDQKKDQDKNKQDQNKQDQKKQDQEKKDNQQQSNKDQNQDKQKPEPSPQKQKQDDMKKEEAKHLIEQFSDDEKDLNKKPEKIGILKNKNVEKDW
jgi:Ca-activated chloride channel family protein